MCNRHKFAAVGYHTQCYFAWNQYLYMYLNIIFQRKLSSCPSWFRYNWKNFRGQNALSTAYRKVPDSDKAILVAKESFVQHLAESSFLAQWYHLGRATITTTADQIQEREAPNRLESAQRLQLLFFLNLMTCYIWSGSFPKIKWCSWLRRLCPTKCCTKLTLATIIAELSSTLCWARDISDHWNSSI